MNELVKSILIFLIMVPMFLGVLWVFDKVREIFERPWEW